MKKIMSLLMAWFFLLFSSNLALSKTIKFAQGSSWPTFVDFSRLTNKPLKVSPPNKKTPPKKNKR